jgi:hypothetical protein
MTILQLIMSGIHDIIGLLGRYCVFPGLGFTFKLVQQARFFFRKLSGGRPSQSTPSSVIVPKVECLKNPIKNGWKRGGMIILIKAGLAITETNGPSQSTTRRLAVSVVQHLNHPLSLLLAGNHGVLESSNYIQRISLEWDLIRYSPLNTLLIETLV